MQSYQLNGLSENDDEYLNKYCEWLNSQYNNCIQMCDFEIYLDQTNQNIEYQGDQINAQYKKSYTQIGDLIKEGEQLHLFNSNICVSYNQYQKIIQVKSVHHQVQVQNGIGINKKTINYFNDDNRAQDIHFFIQVPKNVTVISISANLGKNQFKTVVKERETEKAQRKSQLYEDFSDIVNIFIGEVEPFQQIQITYEYLEILKVKYNKLWMIQIQPFLEKYSQAQIQYLSQYFQYDNQSRNIYDLNMEIEFDSALHFYRSPSHQIVEQIVRDKQILSCNINDQEQIQPFILLFQFHDQHKPQLLLTHQESQGKSNYCATIQILPQLNQMDPNEAYDAFQQNANIDIQEFSKNSKGEYIFILDRSQSMDGPRLDKAKQALILFLRSLPLDSFYNIISFGYGYLYQYSQTARYSEDNINQSIAYINSYIANYGGTNISYAIEAALCLKRIKGYNRNIFLLTDGESEIEPVLNQIQGYSKPDVRFYTIGIGQDCNQYLMEKIAFLGNGMWSVIDDNSDLNSVVIGMLSDSIVPWDSNFKISSNIPKDQIQMISTQLQKVNVLQKNQPIIFQIIFNLKEEQKQGNYFQISYQEQNKQEQVIQIPIDNTNSIQSNIMHKMAIKQETQKIQEFARMQENEIENLGQIDRAIDKKELEQLSVNYQVITPFTTVQSQIVRQQEQENKLNSQINLIQQEESIHQDDQCSQINQIAQVYMGQQLEEINIASEANQPEQGEQVNQTSKINSIKIENRKHKKPLQDFFEKFKQSQTKIQANNKLSQILDCFHHSGYFQQHVLEIINVNLKDFIILENLNIQCQLNIVVLKALETQYIQSKGEWEQIYVKAINYLSQNQIDFQNLKHNINIPLLSNQVNYDQQKVKENIKQVENYKNTFNKIIMKRRLQKLLSTFSPNGQINDTILIILEYDQQNLVCGKNYANQLCILFMASLENIFFDFRIEWQNSYDRVSSYLRMDDDDYNQYKDKVDIPKLNFNTEIEDRIENLINQQLKAYKMQLELKNLMLKRLDLILKTFKSPGQFETSLLIILEQENKSNLSETNNQQLCLLFLVTLDQVFKEFQVEWKEKYDKTVQYLLENRWNYDILKSKIDVPELHFDNCADQRIFQRLIQYKQQEQHRIRLMKPRLDQILNTFDSESKIIDESLWIILEQDHKQMQNKNNQNIYLLFLVTLDQVFKEFQIDWKPKYDQVIQYLIQINVNFEEQRDQVKVPKLHFEQCVQYNIDKYLRVVGLKKQRLIQQQKELRRLMRARLDKLLSKLKNAQYNENDEELLIILEENIQNWKNDGKIQHEKICLLILITLEKQFIEFRELWQEKFNQINQCLQEDNINYDEQKDNISTPNLEFTQVKDEKIEKKLISFQIKQEQIKVELEKKMKIALKEQQRLREERLNLIISTLDLDGAVNEKLLLLVLEMNQQQRFDKNQLCIIFLLTLEKYFMEFQEKWGQYHKQVLEYLNRNNINYDEQKSSIDIPILNFDQAVLNQIVIKLDSIRKSQQYEKLQEGGRNVLIANRFTLFKETYKGIGQIDESLLLIVEQDKEKLIHGKNLKNQLCILFMAVLEKEKNFARYFKECKLKFQATQEYLEQNNDPYSKYKDQIELPIMHFDQQTSDLINQKLKQKPKRR